MCVCGCFDEEGGTFNAADELCDTEKQFHPKVEATTEKYGDLRRKEDGGKRVNSKFSAFA